MPSISIGGMVSMLVLWAGGRLTDTVSGAFNGSHYLNGLRHIYATWWTYLALNVGLYTEDCTCNLLREMRLL